MLECPNSIDFRTLYKQVNTPLELFRKLHVKLLDFLLAQVRHCEFNIWEVLWSLEQGVLVLFEQHLLQRVQVDTILGDICKALYKHVCELCCHWLCCSFFDKSWGRDQVDHRRLHYRTVLGNCLLQSFEKALIDVFAIVWNKWDGTLHNLVFGALLVRKLV